ncbi:MAG: cation:proton antiporter [Eubacteriales bacterium]
MLTSLAWIFLVGLLLSHLAGKLKLPALIGMLLTGMVLGPYGCNVLDETLLDISGQLRQVALVIILLRAGLALRMDDLRKAGRPAILLCFVPACCEIAGVTLLAPMLLPVTHAEAALLGSVLAAVSPAVIVPRMLRLMEQKRGTGQQIPQMLMAGASADDVLVIVLFTTFSGMVAGEQVNWSSIAQVPVSIVLGVAGGIAAGYLLARFWKSRHMRDSVKVLILLSVCFLLLELENQLEGTVAFSGLLAVMSAGAALLWDYPVLAGRLSAKMGKLWVAAEVLLFVLVGATVDMRYAVQAGGWMLLVVAGGLVFRVAGVALCVAGSPLRLRERLFCMIAYLPKATVQAAIGGLPLAMGLSCGRLVLTAAVLAILVTAPLGAWGIDQTAHRWLRQEE